MSLSDLMSNLTPTFTSLPRTVTNSPHYPRVLLSRRILGPVTYAGDLQAVGVPALALGEKGKGDVIIIPSRGQWARPISHSRELPTLEW